MLSATAALLVGLALRQGPPAALAAASGAPPPPPLRLVLDPASAPAFRSGAAFFTAAPNGFNNNLTLVPPLLSDLRRLGEAQLLGWDGVGQALRTEPLVDTVSAIRLLGGWGSAAACEGQAPIPGCVPTPEERRCCARNGTREPCCPPASWSDIAFRQPDGALGHRWPLLWTRLDPLINNSIHPIVVLDNVDYVFVKNFSIGKYGQSKAPDDLGEYGGFITELVTRVVQRYGRARAESFWWRVATEPNTGRGGTGQNLPAPQAEKIETYVDYYVAVCAAVRKVLPQAVVGPGNFASFFQQGFACNSSSGPHANQGLNLIVPMIKGILSKGGSIGFLATSFYGGDHGNIPGSDTPCARFAGCGYDPRQARAAGEGLRYLRGLDPALADVPLQVQEYAAMVNAEGRGPTFEPGAFGGACKIVMLSRFVALSVSLIQKVSLFQGRWPPASSSRRRASIVSFTGI